MFDRIIIKVAGHRDRILISGSIRLLTLVLLGPETMLSGKLFQIFDDFTCWLSGKQPLPVNFKWCRESLCTKKSTSSVGFTETF